MAQSPPRLRLPPDLFRRGTGLLATSNSVGTHSHLTPVCQSILQRGPEVIPLPVHPLAKWLLAIPHFIILFFLWIAAIVATMIAWFATDRYPLPACALDT